MHQPYYREGHNGSFHLPWVYLHGVKDYTDMAFHLENHPEMYAVVNFSPVLLEQLDDYVKELKKYHELTSYTVNPLSDPLLSLLAGTKPIPKSTHERKQLFEECKRCYAPRMIEPYPAFHRLVTCLEDAFKHADKRKEFPLLYLDDQYFYDLLVWYHLAWLGQSLKDSNKVKELFEKEHDYSSEDRKQLLTIIYEALSGIIPRYRALSESGQIELSLTPYAHPIVPLLNSFENMRCSSPEAAIPNCDDYPGGGTRSKWHMEKGIKSFQYYFGKIPDGVWLSEGGISADAIELLDKLDISWTASGEQVWRNTCDLNQLDSEEVHNKKALFKPYQYKDHKTQLYFRDDGLSDLIGFEYSHWNAQDAAHNFVINLQNIAEFLGDNAGNYVVSIILDGENAWEYYLDNGYHFLDALYKEMTQCDDIEVTTFSKTSATIEAIKIDQICSGSWVYGSFTTWIGQEDKNRAWEYLVAAKQACDRAVSASNLSNKRLIELEGQLAICEGSDWFWWFGDYNPSDSVSDFDDLFRIQLKKLYKLIEQEQPAYLNEPISRGGGNAENAGTMRRNK
jgi:alpha-amylase/alpha-mannosidase (GH57 family)